jgi:hypothetical protein
LRRSGDDVDQTFELGRGRWQLIGTVMAGSRQRPPREVHLVRGLGVLEVGLETEQLHPYRSVFDPEHLVGERLVQTDLESLSRQDRGRARPQPGGLRGRMMQQTDGPLEDLGRRHVA